MSQINSVNAPSAEFDACFKDVMTGLLMYHPSLRLASVVTRLRERLSPGWAPTGNTQQDYVALRDAVESKIPEISEVVSQQIHTVSIKVEVVDEQALYQAAVNRSKDCGLTQEDADMVLMKDGIVNINACLAQVFDLVKSPAGVQIIGSNASQDDSE